MAMFMPQQASLEGGLYPQDPSAMYNQQLGMQELMAMSTVTEQAPILCDDLSMNQPYMPQLPPGVFMMPDTQQTIQQGPDGVAYQPAVMFTYLSDPSSLSMQQSAEQGYQQPSQWKKGANPSRKQAAGAVDPEEVQQCKLAVAENMRMKLQRGISDNTCSTAEGSASDAEDGSNDDSAEDLCKVPDARYVPAPPTRWHLDDKIAAAEKRLESKDAEQRQIALKWVAETFWPLSMSKMGCRLVQNAMDVAPPSYQLQLLENMRGYVHDALYSPHANYVLQKFIKNVTPERIQFIVDELNANVLYVARHRFGCRILQRLMEHCAPWQLEFMINKVLSDAAALCRHQYGNFILQHILQYGSPSQRSTIAQVVHSDILRLSKHRLASHIVSCALVNCSPEDIKMLTEAVLSDSGQLYQLSRREYGSFVVREVNRAAKMLEKNSAAADEA